MAPQKYEERTYTPANRLTQETCSDFSFAGSDSLTRLDADILWRHVTLLTMRANAGGFTQVHYFAYGSNLNWPQMQRRCPSARFVCVARLPNYQFGITRHSRLRDCGTANVVAQKGREVWGAVYDVSDSDLLIMDGFEDGYRREFLPVYPHNERDQPIVALVYVAEIESNVPLPNAEYKRIILEGARHWNISSSYIAMLETIQTGG
jgi:gamma-glutamylcyclotransferase